eukprot:286287-Prorocentrum_minimum.AAC.2
MPLERQEGRLGAVPTHKLQFPVCAKARLERQQHRPVHSPPFERLQPNLHHLGGRPLGPPLRRGILDLVGAGPPAVVAQHALVAVQPGGGKRQLARRQRIELQPPAPLALHQHRREHPRRGLLRAEPQRAPRRTHLRTGVPDGGERHHQAGGCVAHAQHLAVACKVQEDVRVHDDGAEDLPSPLALPHSGAA